MPPKAKFTPVGVIGKVLNILELLDRAPGGLQLKDIAGKTDINKSTAYRFLSHLEGEGYLFRDTAGNYMVGPKLTRMGSGASAQATLAKVCRPILENLRKVTGETINLAILDGTDILYIDVLETFHTFRLASEVGMRRPFYSTALGKAILAGMGDSVAREELCASIHFERTTPHTITSVAKLKKQFTTIQQQGFSLEEEEAVAGVCCLGAAIFGADGEVAGGISISGPVVRITKDRLTAFSKEICKAAREISWSLSHHESLPNANPKGRSK
jgi:DNA-binding IclR family transcriptional regulator